MIDFMYTGDYNLSTDAVDEANDPASSQSEHPDEEEQEIMLEILAETQLRRHIQVNAIAGYFNIPGLWERSNSYIRPILQGAFPWFIFPIAVQEALNTTGDQELREVLTEAAIVHIVDLVSVPEFFKMENSNEFYATLCKRRLYRSNDREHRTRVGAGAAKASYS
jgi:hypothetical protein